VRINGRLSNFFDIDIGLRQGCLLSPLLFDIFIDGLVEEIRRTGKGVQYGEVLVGILLFADDIVLVAESREDLEVLMEVVWKYSQKWRFLFNFDKSAVVIFEGKTRGRIQYGDCKEVCVCGRHWKFGEGFIMEVEVYKYLGVEFDRGCTFSVFKSRILDRARKNRVILGSAGSKKGRLSVKANINLWEG